MEPKKPTGLKIETPVTMNVPEPVALPEEPEEVSWDKKHPLLANLLHYSVIGVILLLIFLGGALFLGARAKGSLSIGGIIMLSIGTGIYAVNRVVKSMTSDEYDQGDSGF